MSRYRVVLFLIFLTLLAGLSACGVSGDSGPVTPPAPYPDAPAIPETRLLTLDYPESIRLGDSDVVRLDFDPKESLPNAPFPSAYERYNVLAEARLEMPGVIVRPKDEVSEPFLPGQPVTFYWNVQPLTEGEHEGTVWFYLHFVPKEGGKDQRVALSAQRVTLRVTSLWGISTWVVQLLGLAGAFLGAVLLAPFVVALFGRVGGRSRPVEITTPRNGEQGGGL